MSTIRIYTAKQYNICVQKKKLIKEDYFIKDDKNEGLKSYVFNEHNKLSNWLQYIQANISWLHECNPLIGLLHIIFLTTSCLVIPILPSPHFTYSPSVSFIQVPVFHL